MTKSEEKDFDLVSEFWAIAKANYDVSFGWSVFTECSDDQEIRDIYGNCTSRAQLFERMAECASVWTNKFDDAQQYLKEAGL